jgi:hypothetical protein
MATSERAGLRGRLIAGAIGGIVGTAAMTAAMRRLHRRLPARERYPLPPREITERTTPGASEAASADLTLVNHFGFGAAAGALMAGAGPPGVAGGSLWGVFVWLASYFGWAPATGILRPASSHPARRNALMVLVHLVWGSVAALTAREVLAARATSFAGGELRDAPAKTRR